MKIKLFPHNIFQSLLVVLLVFLTMFFCIFLNFSLGIDLDILDLGKHNVYMIYAGLITTSLVLWLNYRKTDFLPPVNTNFKPIITPLLLVILFLFSYTGLQYYLGFSTSKGTPYEIDANFICIVFLGPIVEELIFRSVILSGLRSKHSVKYAIWVSTILFTLIHAPHQYFHALILGLLLAYTYHISNNILASIVLHIFCNHLSILLDSLQFQYGFFKPSILSLSFYIISLIAMVYILMKFVKKYNNLI